MMCFRKLKTCKQSSDLARGPGKVFQSRRSAMGAVALKKYMAFPAAD